MHIAYTYNQIKVFNEVFLFNEYVAESVSF